MLPGWRGLLLVFNHYSGSSRLASPRLLRSVLKTSYRSNISLHPFSETMMEGTDDEQANGGHQSLEQTSAQGAFLFRGRRSAGWLANVF